MITIDLLIHNHAFMVLQFTAAMVTNCDIHIPDIELFSILVTAHIHDVDHPGTNNDFIVKTNSKYSQMYKESVLENHPLEYRLLMGTVIFYLNGAHVMLHYFGKFLELLSYQPI